MKRIKEIFDENVVVEDVVKKGKCLLATINDRRYVIKDKTNNDINNIFSYLLSRNFEYFPKNIIENDKYTIYQYIEDIDNPIEQKAYDMITMLSLLHNKTTYYKDMDIDEYKEIYENISFQIESRMNYYNNLISIIESNLFMSPSCYLIARNISKILGALDYSKRNINEWYDLVKTKGKKRVVILYNNIDLNHIIRNKDIYLISWDKSKEGIPIYDLYNFYLKYSNIINFENLLKHYEERYPLLEEEKKLFNILISIPKEIEFVKNEMNNCKNVKKMIDSLYKSEILIS